MVDYKKLYSYLVCEIDRALTLMDEDNFLQYQRVKTILQNALLTTEDIYINESEE